MDICERNQQYKEQNIQNELKNDNIQIASNLQSMKNMPNNQNTQDLQNIKNDQHNGAEMALGRNLSVPIDIIIKARQSVCKINIKGSGIVTYATGFFMKISNTENYLVTNNHIISQRNIYDDIEIEIHNKKTMKLNLNNRKIKYFEKPKDITIIEIKNSDPIYDDILFLDYDFNYKKGYYIYKNADIFLIQHPHGQSAEHASGKIVNINDFEFDHDISTENGSSGSPIILFTKNINLIQVIGVHKKANYDKNLNSGTFIGEIFTNENNNIINDKINKINNNYITAELDIKDDNVNKDIRIINSYEEYMRKDGIMKRMKKKLMNEEEIKQCEIRINDILIPFNYFYKFTKKRKYIIKYSFNNNLTKTNYLFYECSSLTNINLSNFNSQNITDMRGMFWSCSSLKNINFSNFNTCHVRKMNYMFFYCSSLTNINLSNFNTQNVKNMSGMFWKCSSLASINLSNFDTHNVTNMSFMFYECSSLRNINIANFNTNKVTDMNHMFSYCSSLTNIDLSNFNTLKVTDLGFMFCGCKSLTNINLSNFNTQNVFYMSYMFEGCESLKNFNLITNNKDIIKQFNNNNN